ncbi:hypothetical protein LPJ64_004341 [Coemansia asiatica]|uniref:beta-glucosidase n=1 Tax=Coemansia asiatica TaxID=1052880 RepID=A0A9W7XI33_9FUNG|nr:hypothetical protein LPJ64_004341 [Coemansia asiatica]
MAQADSSTQEQQPLAALRSRRGRYLSITPWAIALLLVAQRAEALQQPERPHMATRPATATGATTHGSIIAAVASSGFRPQAALSTRVQGLGRLAGSDDKGDATDSDNEGSGSDSDSEEQELFKKGGKEKSHKKHDGHGHGHDHQGPAYPYQSVPNPYQSVPNPYQSVPNPYQSVPNPYQSVPNPYQSVPNPYQSVPNPYQSVPNPYHSVPNPCQPVPYPYQPVPGSTAAPLPVAQQAQGNVAAIVYSPVATVQPPAPATDSVTHPTITLPTVVVYDPLHTATTLPLPITDTVTPPTVITDEPSSSNGYGHFGFPEADGFENYYSTSGHSHSHSHNPAPITDHPQAQPIPTVTSISIVPYQIPASAQPPVTVTNTEKTTVTESFTTFTTNVPQQAVAPATDSPGNGGWGATTIVQNFYETTVVPSEGNLYGPQIQPPLPPNPTLFPPPIFPPAPIPRPNNGNAYGPQVQPPVPIPRPATSGNPWLVIPTSCPHLQSSAGLPRHHGFPGPVIPTGGPQIQPTFFPTPIPRPGTGAGHACQHGNQPWISSTGPWQQAANGATTIIQQSIYMTYPTVAPGFSGSHVQPATSMNVSTAITTRTAYVGATIMSGDRVSRAQDALSTTTTATPVTKFTDEENSSTATEASDSTVSTDATPIFRPHGSHHALTDSARNGVEEDVEAFTPRSFNANTLDGGFDAAQLNTAHNRPEVGQTTSTSTGTGTAAMAAAQTTSTVLDAADGQTHIIVQSDIEEDSENIWERMLHPTKTANLPELLERPLSTPDALPVAPPEQPAINGLRLDPAQPGGVDFYSTTELAGLRSADFPAKISEDVWRVVESMTLEEKIGQMLQVPVGKLLTPDGQLNATALDFWINTAKAGTFVDTPGNSVHGRYAWYAPQTLANLTNTVQQVALASGSRVPALWAIDAVRGSSFVKRATMFPAGVGLAATMQPQFAYAAGRIAAKDSRAAGYSLAFAPSADLGVDKRSGAGFLGFGEDPAVASIMMRHTVRGLQGDYKTDRHRVAACVRHFIGAGAVPDNTLFEYHLPGFQAAVGAGVAAMEQQHRMALNGQALSAAPFYLRTLLRDSLGFRGVMIGDSAVSGLRAAANATDSVFLALNNTSIDISAKPNLFTDTVNLVRNGVVREDRVTESVARIVQLKKDLGLFDKPFADSSLFPTVGALQDVEVARSAVRESLTLLKNAGRALPLRTDDRVLFIGAHLNSTALLGGGWSVHRNGPTRAEAFHDAVFEGLGHSVIQGVEQVTGRTATYHPGLSMDPSATASDDDRVIDVLARKARQSDKIVIGLGETPYSGDRSAETSDLSLDARQLSLVQRLSALTNKPIVVLLVTGRPRILHDIPARASSILLSYLPGIHGGLPIAQVLYGQASPSGRLPFTYPKHEYQARDTMWQSQSLEYAPQYPFGFGLGYSPMQYSDITVDSTELRPGNPVTIRMTIHNQGTMDQREPVLLYTSQNFRTGYEPELFRLRKFDKVEIKAGMATQISFTLKAEELAYYNRDLTKVIDPSPVNITINALTPHERTVTVNLSV